MTSYCLNSTHRLSQVTWHSGLLAQSKEHFIVEILYPSPLKILLIGSVLGTHMYHHDMIYSISILYTKTNPKLVLTLCPSSI